MEDEVHCYWDEQHEYIYAGVYDGHGGPAAANWLKQHLHTTVAKGMEIYLPKPHIFHKGHNPERPPELTDILIKAFEDADDHLLNHLEKLGGEELASAGSTASVAVIRKDRVVLANVGDSQAFLMRNGRELSLVTPHRVYGQGPDVQAEVDRIKAAGGWIHDGRVCNILAVSRAFGDWEFKGKGLQSLLQTGVTREYWPQAFADAQKFTSNPVIVTPDATDTDLTEDDEFLVLSTDGLWDVMPAREAMQWARRDFLKGLRPAQIAESLIQVALKRYTSDNTSTVVVDLKGPEYWAEQAAKQKKGISLFGGLFGGKK